MKNVTKDNQLEFKTIFNWKFNVQDCVYINIAYSEFEARKSIEKRYGIKRTEYQIIKSELEGEPCISEELRHLKM